MLSLSLMVGTAHALAVQQIGNFDEPIYLTSDPGNPERLFIVERQGTILLLDNGQLKPFADIRSAVSCCEGERGLLAIALAPDFDASGRFYLYYTGKEEPGEIHVGEMVASGSSAPFLSLRDVITPIPHPEETNHDGGQLQFGPEGALFFATGDGVAATTNTTIPEPEQRVGEAPADRPDATDLLGPAGNPFPFALSGRRSGASGCATPSASPSTGSPEIYGSVRRAGRTRGGRLRRRTRPRSRGQLRLELHGGQPAGSAAA